MPIISVVMPAYNAEEYIAEAIESVINQTFKDWELIIVDDCSQDNTFFIASKYVHKDNRIKLYKLENNSGSAYIPRKKAIELSQSEWIVALDADDFIDKEDLSILYSRQNETHADIVLHRLIRINDNGKEEFQIPASNFNFKTIISGKEACLLTIGQWIINGNGLFRKELYNQIWIKKSDYTGMNGDELLTRLLFLSAEKIAFCKAKYFYRYNPLSISNKFSTKSFDILQTNRELKKLVFENYGRSSNAAQQIILKQWQDIKLCCNLLYTNKKLIPKTKQKALKSEIYQDWKELEWNVIKPCIKKYSHISFLLKNFSFYIFLTKCRIYAKRIKKL